jgi:hypothetical protein
VRNSPLDKIATFGLNLVACIKGTCQYGIYSGAALSLGLSIDELLLNYGREPVFRNVFGKGLDRALNKLGFENPNKDITSLKDNIKTLKYRYKELKNLNQDLDELDSIEEVDIKDSELVKEIKKDIKKRIESEKASIFQSRNSILSQLSENNAFKKR